MVIIYYSGAGAWERNNMENKLYVYPEVEESAEDYGSQEGPEISCDIKEHLGILHTSGRGWTKEINLISWNGRAPKLDIREWNPDHSKCMKGVTLSEEEAKTLSELLAKKLKGKE